MASFTGPTLVVVAHGASGLKDVEAIGKQDAYLQFTVRDDFQDYQKTTVHKGAGSTPVWNNQTFNVALAGQPELYLEIMDQEVTADAIIAFASIPINYVVFAPGATLSGHFAVFTPEGQPNGHVHLTLTAYNVPGQNTAPPNPAQPPQCFSHTTQAHQARAMSLKRREQAADAGAAVAGGLLAVGVGLLANKLMGGDKHESKSEKQHFGESSHHGDKEGKKEKKDKKEKKEKKEKREGGEKKKKKEKKGSGSDSSSSDSD
ncbi:hypothetical protein BGX34_004255 [Mortierella sp. NVP85]|nr:hypothetical protein BGX34_004255 [Mortierella sp. NVP85]